MKRRLLSLSLALCMIISILPLSALAADYDGHWAAPYIEQANARGWMLGDGNGNFKPDAPITRAEFAVMLWRALGSPAPQGACPFSDIPADAYYRDAVTALYEAGIVSGYGGGLFGPNDTLTREMAFVMLTRAFGLAPSGPGEASEYTKFDDHAQVSAWATDAASVLVLKGYVEGSGNMLLPKKALTRGEMAKLLITVYDGEQWEEDKPPVTPEDKDGPAITLSQSPTASTTGSVSITVTATDDSGVAYIGWRKSASGTSYTDKTGFTDITSAKKFTISANGWYAVCATDTLGNFSYKLIQITNITGSSSGGGGGTSSTVPSVTGVTVSPASVSVVNGSTQQFTAKVDGTNNPAQTVTWSVEGGVSGTNISVGGLLTVAANETAALLTVRATSTADNNKSGIATVTVTVQTLTIEVTGGGPAEYVRGGSLQFTALLNGSPVTAVTWAIDSAATPVADTAISPAGKLTVGTLEPAELIKITASLPGNPGVTAAATAQCKPRVIKAFENGQPNKHLGDHTIEYAQITFEFTTLYNIVVDAIRMKGFAEGTTLYIGTPGQPGTTVVNITSESQVITFTHENFTGNGVFMLPPTDYTDVDMDIYVEVDYTNNDTGLTATFNDTYYVIVDAVADRPEDITGTADADNASHVMRETVTKEQKFEDGYDKTQYTVTAAPGEARVNVDFNVTATFADYANGSELHYVLIEQLPGFTGNYSTVTDPDGVTYFQVPVSNAEIAANNGTVTVPATPQTAQVVTDTDYSVRVGAMAQETPRDRELRLDNNVAYNSYEDTVDFFVDVIDATLTVTSGWASEGNDPSKHTSDPYVPDYAGMNNGAGVDFASTTADGAPITLSLGNASGSVNSIQSVTFTYDGARGTLEYNGHGTVTQSVAPDGTVTYTVEGINSDSLVCLTFKPATTGPQSYNDDDVTLGYKMTVINNAGASAVFSSSSMVIIDAVADQATDMAAGVNYDAGETSVISGGTVSLHIVAQFHDYADGSETHSLVIDPSVVANIEPGDLPAGMTLVTGVEAAAFGSNTGLAGLHFIIKVDPSYLQDNNGRVDFNLNVTIKDYSSEQSGLSVNIKAVAVEGDGLNTVTGANSSEYDAVNNVAVSEVSTSIDVNVL